LIKSGRSLRYVIEVLYSDSSHKVYAGILKYPLRPLREKIMLLIKGSGVGFTHRPQRRRRVRRNGFQAAPSATFARKIILIIKGRSFVSRRDRKEDAEFAKEMHWDLEDLRPWGGAGPKAHSCHRTRVPAGQVTRQTSLVVVCRQSPDFPQQGGVLHLPAIRCHEIRIFEITHGRLRCDKLKARDCNLFSTSELCPLPVNLPNAWRSSTD